MKALNFGPIFIVALMFFTACKEKEELTTVSNIKTIEDPINGPLPPDPTDPTPPGQGPIRVFEIKGRPFTKDEVKRANFAYTRLFFPVGELGKNYKSKKCKHNKDKCVRNRQIPFAFDLAVLKGEDPQSIVVKDMIVDMGLTSIGENYRTELFCFLELKTCSGNAITRHPTLGIPWFIKSFAWDGTFWKKGHDQTMLTKDFHETLEQGKVTDGHYVVENGKFSMKKLFLLSSDNLKEYIFLKDNIRFEIADDTFVSNPVLKVYIQDKLTSNEDRRRPVAPIPDVDEHQVLKGYTDSDIPYLNEILSE